MKVKMGCMESMRHPYIPSTTVLGDLGGYLCKFNRTSGSGYLVVVTMGLKMKVKMGFFMRHPYIPSTIVLGDRLATYTATATAARNESLHSGFVLVGTSTVN